MDNVVEMVSKQLREYVNPAEPTFSRYAALLLHDKAEYLDRFIEKKPFPPFEVEIQISSKCDLSCRWCIGGELQEKKHVLELPNRIKDNFIDKIVEDIINCEIGGLRIKTVKFSGFIGEPLLYKKKTLKAIKLLHGADIQVGLFTNGVLMDDDDTRRALLNIDYVHVSLDAGRSSFFWLKESSKENANYSEEKFDKVISNIARLNELRIKKKNSPLRINIGYVIVPGNHDHIYDTARIVKEAGADSIRFKCDIGGWFALKDEQVRNIAFNQVAQVEQELRSELFDVRVVHSKEDVINNTYKKWNTSLDKAGCFYHNFLATIGSDGNLYFCDHNTMPSAVSLGSVVDDKSFSDVWLSDRRKFLTDDLRYLCDCGVCPPFGNAVNFFLKKINDLREAHGVTAVMDAVTILRNEYGGDSA